MGIALSFRSDGLPRGTSGRPTRSAQSQASDEAMMDPALRQRIDQWVAEAHAHTVVVTIDSQPGFLADCVVAPGAITVGRNEQEARDEMRSALTDWANLRVTRGYDLPKLPSDAVSR